MVNICAGFTFPAFPDVAFDLVLATMEFNSILLSMAESDDDKDKIDPEELANEIFSKNSKNIRNTFEHILKSSYDLNPENYYVVADRAAENVKAFGKRYLCCAGHQFDNCFKQAIREMQRKKPDSNLVKSWTSLENLMTFAKEHFLVFRYPDGNFTRFLSIRKFSSTRWIGLILQSEKLIKAEQDV